MNHYDHCPDPDCDCAECLQWNAYARGAAEERTRIVAIIRRHSGEDSGDISAWIEMPARDLIRDIEDLEGAKLRAAKEGPPMFAPCLACGGRHGQFISCDRARQEKR